MLGFGLSLWTTSIPAVVVGTGWTPASLSAGKLKSWLKGATVTGTNGAAIGTWPDSSGNANDATQAAANKPTLVTAGLNGLNTIAFDGPTAQYFTLPTGLLTGRTSPSSFAVWKINTNPPASSGVSGPVFGDFGTFASSNHEPFTDGNFYSDYCSTTRRTVTGVVESTAWHIQSFMSAANNWRFNFDGTNVFTDAVNTVGLNTAPLVGYSAAAPAALDGQVAETVDCEGLTTGEEQQVEGYLAWRFGLQGNLPVGHPYKSAAP